MTPVWDLNTARCAGRTWLGSCLPSVDCTERHSSGDEQ